MSVAELVSRMMGYDPAPHGTKTRWTGKRGHKPRRGFSRQRSWYSFWAAMMNDLAVKNWLDEVGGDGEEDGDDGGEKLR